MDGLLPGRKLGMVIRVQIVILILYRCVKTTVLSFHIGTINCQILRFDNKDFYVVIFNDQLLNDDHNNLYTMVVYG